MMMMMMLLLLLTMMMMYYMHLVVSRAVCSSDSVFNKVFQTAESKITTLLNTSPRDENNISYRNRFHPEKKSLFVNIKSERLRFLVVTNLFKLSEQS
jgi:hypothetical protein